MSTAQDNFNTSGPLPQVLVDSAHKPKDDTFDFHQFALDALKAECRDFREMDNLRGDALADALRDYAQTNGLEAITEEDIDALVAPTRLMEELPAPEPAPDVTQEEPPRRDALDRAIADKDHDLLYECVPYLAYLNMHHLPSYAVEERKIKDAFGKAINWTLFNSAIAQAKRELKRRLDGEKIDVADVAAQWASDNKQSWGYDEDAQCWRTYDGQCWQEVDEQASYLDLEAKDALQKAKIAVNSNSPLNAFQRLARPHLKRSFQHSPMKINFQNGTLDITTMRLYRHDRADNFTYCLPYDYETVGDHPAIDAFLLSAIPDLHARQAYMAQIGLALMGDTAMHNFLLLLGPTRAGKSTALALANAICGAREYWTFAPASLFSRELEGKFSRNTWSKNRIVCVDELPDEALRDEEMLKAMSAHSGVPQRGMHKDERDSNRWHPKLIMGTNDTPHYKDTSGAIKQRAIILTFPTHRPDGRQDKRLFQKLAPEIGAFVRTCILMGLRVLDRGYFPRSGEMKRQLDRIANAGNPLKAFLADQCVIDDTEASEPRPRIAIKDFFVRYKGYCEDNNNKAMGQSKTVSALEDMHLGIQRKKARYKDISGEEKVGWCLLGIRWQTSQEQASESEAQYTDDLPLVDVVDACCPDVDVHVNTAEPPVEPVQKPVLTLLTSLDSIEPKGNDISMPGEAAYIYHFPYAGNGSEKTSTTSTRQTEPPVEPLHSPKVVDMPESKTSTTSTGTSTRTATKPGRIRKEM